MAAPKFRTVFARNDDDLRAAQRLRHSVFVAELGAASDGSALEVDKFDADADHLLLLDESRASDDQVIGVYRLMNEAQAKAAGTFSCAAEYDLQPILRSNKNLLELGRSCLHPNYRGGMAMYHLWRALAAYVEQTHTELLFGVASFHGTNPNDFSSALSVLHHHHLAPPEFRVASKSPAHFELEPIERLDKKTVMSQMPSLIKAYLRLGGVIGQGAFIDRSFNTTDVCMILDMSQVSASQRAIYTKEMA